MKFVVLVAAAALGLSACAPARSPAPALPEGVAKSQFSITDDSYLRGVKGSSNTVPRARNPAILDVTYQVECIADGAQSRITNAKQKLDESFVVAPLFFNNPRERGRWRRDASQLIAETGCVVNKLDFTSRTTDPFETSVWAIKNRVPPVN